MRLVPALLLLCAMFALVSCNREDGKPVGNPSTGPTFTAEGGTPAEQLLADIKNRLASDAKVSFHTTLRGAGDEIRADVTWYTDSNGRRQRFDFEGAEKLVGVQNASVFTEGNKDRIVICSDDFPTDPHAKIGAPGPKGACCEGKATCGDAAANAIYLLAFPLGYGNEPEDGSSALSGLDIQGVEKREVAGAVARCYRFRNADPGELTNTGDRQVCFTAAGAEVYWKLDKSDYGDLEVEAFAISSSAPEDFNYPYAVYLAQ